MPDGVVSFGVVARDLGPRDVFDSAETWCRYKMDGQADRCPFCIVAHLTFITYHKNVCQSRYQRVRSSSPAMMTQY